MKAQFFTFLILLSLSGLFACSVEADVDTNEQMLVYEMKEFVDRNHIDRVDVFVYDIDSSGNGRWTLMEDDESFYIDGQFMVVGDTYYNLNKVEKFRLYDGFKVYLR